MSKAGCQKLSNPLGEKWARHKEKRNRKGCNCPCDDPEPGPVVAPSVRLSDWRNIFDCVRLNRKIRFL